MKRLFSLALYLFPLAAGAPLLVAQGENNLSAPSDHNERTIVITAGDSLRFNITKINSFPGERLRVRLRNLGSTPKGSMGHNWILLDSNAETTPYAKAALTGKDDNYQPKSFTPHVLASISLLGPKEEGEVAFTAPVKPGTYPYFCSFPGHQMAGMRGELIVK